MLKIYLLRHGETTYNANGNRYCGSTDIGLTEKGLQQAKDIARSLQTIAFDAVYSSPLQRAFITASIACDNRNPVIKDNRLTEVDFGTWEGKTRDEFVAEDPRLWQTWDRDPANSRAGGTGNTAGEIVTRVDNFFVEMQTQYSEAQLLVVAHYTMNRFYLTYKLGMPLRNYRRIIQENSAITLFSLDQQGDLTLEKLNTR